MEQPFLPAKGYAFSGTHGHDDVLQFRQEQQGVAIDDGMPYADRAREERRTSQRDKERRGSLVAETEPDDLEKIDQEIRINELREEARELAGGDMFCFEADEAPPEVLEAFWRDVVETERSGWTSAREQLEKDGVRLPPPDELSDEEVALKLQEVISRLVKFHTYLYHTDHLSNRELYAELSHEVLNEQFPEMLIDSPTGVYVIDMIGSGSEEDTDVYMRYYADEKEREHWMKDFPDYQMPPREQVPYDRDRLLPQPPEGW